MLFVGFRFIGLSGRFFITGGKQYMSIEQRVKKIVAEQLGVNEEKIKT